MGLGKKLKKLGGKALNIGTLGLFGEGPFSGDPGDPAPNAPNLAFLDDISKFNFLKDSGSRYGSLRDAPASNRYLVNPSGLASGAAALGADGDSAFQDLLGSLNVGPSSVDEVMSQIDDEGLQQLLGSIDEDTRTAAGDLSMDFADRGVAGPGQLSDAEASGLGRLSGLGVKAKAAARTDVAKAKLGRLADQEKMLTSARIGAYGQRYGNEADQANQIIQMLFGAGESEADRSLQTELGLAGFESGDTRAYADILNARDLGKAGQLTSQYTTQYNNRRPPTDSIGMGLLKNVNIGIPIGG